MLADPVTVAAASPTPELKLAIVSVNGTGTQRVDTNGGGYTVNINHTSTSKAHRHYVQMTLNKNATDPYSGLTKPVQASVSLTIVRPLFGFSDADMIALSKALTDFRDDSEVTTQRLLQRQA